MPPQRSLSLPLDGQLVMKTKALCFKMACPGIVKFQFAERLMTHRDCLKHVGLGFTWKNIGYSRNNNLYSREGYRCQTGKTLTQGSDGSAEAAKQGGTSQQSSLYKGRLQALRCTQEDRPPGERHGGFFFVCHTVKRETLKDGMFYS